MKNLKRKKHKNNIRCLGHQQKLTGRRTCKLVQKQVIPKNRTEACLRWWLLRKAKKMQQDYWKNKLIYVEVIMTLTLGLALVFTLRDLVFLKWPIEGFGFPARLALKGLPFALVTLLVIWIHRLQKQELERKGITDDNLFEPDGVTRDLQALALIARANSRNPSHALVRAFNRGSEVWLKRYAKALTRQFGFLGMRMRTRMNNQAFLLKEQFLDLHFGMIGSSGDGRRETAGFLSSFHEELSVGFGLRTQRDDSRVTFVDFLRMDMVARVVLLAALAVLVRKPEWRVPAMLYASGLFVLFGHTKSLEKIQESILEKVNFLK